MTGWIAALGSLVAVSAIPLIGLLALRSEAWTVRITPSLVGLATGALLGSALFDLIPAGSVRLGGGSLPGTLVVVGFIGFFALDKFFGERPGPLRIVGSPISPLAALNLIGDALHNVLDGVIIAGTFVVAPTLGMATTLAVVLHEIPHELGDLGILLHTGLSIRRAVGLNLLSGGAALLGGIVTLLFGRMADPGTMAYLLPIAGGGFLYIGAAKLVPQMLPASGFRVAALQIGWMLAGVGVLALVPV